MGFVDSYGPWAVVLGASEGLGEAFAAGVAARGVNVVVAARRSDLLGRVADGISNAHNVQSRAVTLDLGDPGFLEDLRSATEGLEVGLVVYNATGVYTGEFEGTPRAPSRVGHRPFESCRSRAVRSPKTQSGRVRPSQSIHPTWARWLPAEAI